MAAKSTVRDFEHFPTEDIRYGEWNYLAETRRISASHAISSCSGLFYVPIHVDPFEFCSAEGAHYTGEWVEYVSRFVGADAARDLYELVHDLRRRVATGLGIGPSDLTAIAPKPATLAAPEVVGISSSAGLTAYE